MIYRTGRNFRFSTNDCAGLSFLASPRMFMMNMIKRQCGVRHVDIAIIGGGCSGVLLCIHLLRNSQVPMSIAVIDRSPHPGRGIAYGTRCDDHLLNVRVSGMSALPDNRLHFWNWLVESGLDFAPDSFVPRRFYGDYLESTLDRAVIGCPHCQLSYLTDEAIFLDRVEDGFRVVLSSGSLLTAAQIVLATGNARPSDPLLGKCAASHLYAEYAWTDNALQNVPSDGEVLIIGSGLTAIDQILALKARGFLGRISMISRRGKLPATHGSSAAWAAQWGEPLPDTVSSALQRIRREIRAASRYNVDWRSVIDSLRPWTSAIWQRWSSKEKRRFLRHARPFWEAARHRLPPSTTQTISDLTSSGALRIIAGRITEVAEEYPKVRVSILLRGRDEKVSLSADRIINCTGPGTSHRLHEPLIEKLSKSGLVQYDDLGVGIRTNGCGRVVRVSGVPAKDLFALGPMRKATLWETTAVPEIRDQASKLAQLLISQIDHARVYRNRRRDVVSSAALGVQEHGEYDVQQHIDIATS